MADHRLDQPRPAPVAQWIEQPPPKRKVASSTLAWGTHWPRTATVVRNSTYAVRSPEVPLVSQATARPTWHATKVRFTLV